MKMKVHSTETNQTFTLHIVCHETRTLCNFSWTMLGENSRNDVKIRKKYKWNC